MNYDLVAKRMRQVLLHEDPAKFSQPLQDPEGLTDQHALWMLIQIKENPNWSEGKKGRWLGWAQAVLCASKHFDLEGMKFLNRMASCDDPECRHHGKLHTHFGPGGKDGD